MKTSKLRNSLLLLLTATIWGVAFVAQSVGMEYVGPYTFNSVRNFIGSAVLIPCIYLLNKINPPTKKDSTLEEKKHARKTLIIAGICCGTLLALASSFSRLVYSTQPLVVLVLLLLVILSLFRFLVCSFSKRNVVYPFGLLLHFP